MKTLRDQGLSYKEIARKVRFSQYAVRNNLVKAYGYDAIEHPSTHIDQVLLKMKDLSNKGFSSRKIVAKLEIRKSTAAKYLKILRHSVIDHYPSAQLRLVGKVDQVMFEKMKMLRDKGLSYTKIASIIGLCRQTVKIHLRLYNPAIVISHPSRKMSAAMIEEAQALRNGGLSYKEIGSKLGVAAKTIWNYLKS